MIRLLSKKQVKRMSYRKLKLFVPILSFSIAILSFGFFSHPGRKGQKMAEFLKVTKTGDEWEVSLKSVIFSINHLVIER